jgi:hypothetical protein
MADFLTALALPQLAGGGAAAGGAGAAAGAGMAALGPWMLAAGGVNMLGNLIGGNQQANSQAAQMELQGAFTKLAPINQRLTYAGQELMANMAPYFGAQAAQTNLLAQSMYDTYSGAKSKEQQMAGLQTGIASQLAGAAIGQQEMAAKGRTALELAAGEKQVETMGKAADVLGLQYTNLAKGLSDVGTTAANVRNQQVLAQTQANLDIGRDLARIKASNLGQQWLRNQAASTALSPRFA